MNRKYVWAGVGLALAAAGSAAFMMKSGGEEAEEVQTTRVERQKIVQKVNATGRIQPKNQVKISADVSIDQCTFRFYFRSPIKTFRGPG